MKDGSYIGFEWDDGKALSNVAKHGISFDEATTAFSDPYGRIIEDPDHSVDEDRFVLLGMSLQANVLIVCHCLRQAGSSIRIISARKATRSEQNHYWRFRK